MRRLLLIIFGLFWEGQALFSQSLFGRTVAGFIFEGLKNQSENDLAAILRPFEGKELTESLAYEAQERLERTGYFSSVVIEAEAAADGQSVLLAAVVKEKPIIGSIRYIGARRLKAGDLNKKLGSIKKGAVFNVTDVARAEGILKAGYEDEGYLQAAVTGSYAIDENGLATLSFTVKEGLPQVVREITVEGLDGLSEDERKDLRKRAISQKTQGFVQKGIFKEESIAQDRESIETFLKSKGYIDARVVDVRIDQAVDEDAGAIYLNIYYTVEEGSQWLYGGLSIAGNNIYTTAELEEPFKNLAPEEPLDWSALQYAYAYGPGSLQSIYNDDGYIFNEYSLDMQRNEADREIYFTITVKEYDRAHIESISVGGNDKTKDFVIRREIPFEEGEVYSSAKMMRAYQNLLSTGYFASVAPDVQQGSEPGLVKVDFQIEEGRTTELMLGISVGGTADQFPISGLFSYGNKNFLGRGYEAKISLSANAEQQKVGLSFYNNYLFGSKFGFGASLNYSRLESTTPQDILFPIFTDTDIPDPYTGAYVYTTDGDDHKAGDYFQGIPTEDEIKDLGLTRDYEYFSADDAFAMDYISNEIGLGLSTGYVFPLPIGYFRLNSGFDISFSHISYDSSAYRPAYAEIRDGLNRWQFNDGIWIKGAWDNRNNPNLTTKGFILSQYFYLAGGYLGGNRTYIKSQTRFDYYFAFPELKITKNWSMNWGLKAHSAFSWTGGQFDKSLKDALVAYYTLDGMFLGRGWSDYSSQGRIMWDNSIEFRLPIIASILWWDTFLDLILLWNNEEAMADTKRWYNNFYGAIGSGFRISIASFPLGVYLIKRFRINEPGAKHAVNWNPGRSPTFSGPGLDIAITFSIDMY